MIVHIHDMDNTRHFQFMSVIDSDSNFVDYVDVSDVNQWSVLVLVCEVNISIASVIPVDVRVLKYEIFANLNKLPILWVVLKYCYHAFLT